MINYREQTEELNQIPIHAVGSLLGLNLPRQGSTNCPFKDHEDKNPSFEIRPQSNKWVCYGCGRKGGAIDLVKQYLEISFLDAKRWLIEQEGNGSVVRQSRVNSDPSNLEPQNTQTVNEEKPPDIELYERLHELCPLQTNGQAYLDQRAITNETIKSFRIGQLNRQNTVKNKLLSEFGFDRLKSSGVLTKRSTEYDCRLVFASDSLLFPFIERSRIVYLQTRSIGSNINRGKYINLNDRRHRIFNVDVLSKTGLKFISNLRRGYGYIVCC